jgi:hypothetical protein
MTPVEHEADLEERIGGLTERLEKLEKQQKSPVAPPKKTPWEIYQLVSPVMQALALAILAYVLTGRITNAIQREQLNLSGTKEMRDLLVLLQGTKPDEAADRQAAAVTLAAFGRFAVGPLIHALDTAQREGRLDTAHAAERALAMNGWSNPEPVCSALVRVIGDPARSFHAETHRSAIVVLGRANCREQLPEVRSYAAQLSDGTTAAALPQLVKIVDEDTPPSATNVEKIRAAAARTIEILERGTTP